MIWLAALAATLSSIALADASVIPSPDDPAGKWEITDCKPTPYQDPYPHGGLQIESIVLNYGATEENHPWHTWHKRTVSGEMQLSLQSPGGGEPIYKGTAFVKGGFDVRPQGSLIAGETYYSDEGFPSPENGFSVRFPSTGSTAPSPGDSDQSLYEITVSYHSHSNRFAAACRFKRVPGLDPASPDIQYALPKPIHVTLGDWIVAIEKLTFTIRLTPENAENPFTVDHFYMEVGAPSNSSVTEKGIGLAMGVDSRGKYLRMLRAIGPPDEVRVYLDSGEVWVAGGGAHAAQLGKAQLGPKE